MPNYYNKTTFERKDIAQELIDLWTETSNPKLAEYILTPPQPTPDAVWGQGEWIIPAPATYTAEEWLSKEGYGDNRPTTLLYQKIRLDALGLTSPKLLATQAWLDAMIASGLAPATADWPPAPHSFDAVLTETLTLLAA
jgi:hypothetical protein